jgi:hypothetical protein
MGKATAAIVIVPILLVISDSAHAQHNVIPDLPRCEDCPVAKFLIRMLTKCQYDPAYHGFL